VSVCEGGEASATTGYILQTVQLSHLIRQETLYESCSQSQLESLVQTLADVDVAFSLSMQHNTEYDQRFTSQEEFCILQ